MKNILLFFFVCLTVGAWAQIPTNPIVTSSVDANPEVMEEEVCWSVGGVDSSLTRFYYIDPSDTSKNQILFYVNASGAVVTVSGGTLTLGYCGCCEPGGGTVVSAGTTETFFYEASFGEDYSLPLDTLTKYQTLVIHAKPTALDTAIITFPLIGDVDSLKGKNIYVYGDGGEATGTVVVRGTGSSRIVQVDCSVPGRFIAPDTINTELSDPRLLIYRTVANSDYTRVCEGGSVYTNNGQSTVAEALDSLFRRPAIEICKTDRDPNLIAALDTIDQRVDCSIVRDTVNNITYEYDATLLVGSRWVARIESPPQIIFQKIEPTDTNVIWMDTSNTYWHERLFVSGQWSRVRYYDPVGKTYSYERPFVCDCEGQSNMEGSAPATQYNLIDTNANPLVTALDTVTGKRVVARLGQNPFRENNGLRINNMCFQFAKKIAEEQNRHVVILMNAYSLPNGISIDQWHPNSSAYINWLTYRDSLGIKRTDAKIWQQGEWPDRLRYTSKEYKEQLDTLIFNWRNSEYLDSTTKILFVDISPDNIDPRQSAVLRSFSNVDDPYLNYVSTTGIPIGPDGVHWDNYGLTQIGERIYEVYQNTPKARQKTSYNEHVAYVAKPNYPELSAANANTTAFLRAKLNDPNSPFPSPWDARDAIINEEGDSLINHWTIVVEAGEYKDDRDYVNWYDYNFPYLSLNGGRSEGEITFHFKEGAKYIRNGSGVVAISDGSRTKKQIVNITGRGEFTYGSQWGVFFNATDSELYFEGKLFKSTGTTPSLIWAQTASKNIKFNFDKLDFSQSPNAQLFKKTMTRLGQISIYADTIDLGATQNIIVRDNSNTTMGTYNIEFKVLKYISNAAASFIDVFNSDSLNINIKGEKIQAEATGWSSRLFKGTGSSIKRTSIKIEVDSIIGDFDLDFNSNINTDSCQFTIANTYIDIDSTRSSGTLPTALIDLTNGWDFSLVNSKIRSDLDWPVIAFLGNSGQKILDNSELFSNAETAIISNQLDTILINNFSHSAESSLVGTNIYIKQKHLFDRQGLLKELPKGPVTINAQNNAWVIDTAGIIRFQDLDGSTVDYQFVLSPNTSIALLINRYEAGDTMGIRMQAGETYLRNSTGEYSLTDITTIYTGSLFENDADTLDAGVTFNHITKLESAELEGFTATDSTLTYTGTETKRFLLQYNANINFNAGSAGTWRVDIRPYINAANIDRANSTGLVETSGADDDWRMLSGSAVVTLNANDVISLRNTATIGINYILDNLNLSITEL